MTAVAGKAAFVSGGGSGIGRAVAKALASDGAAVAVADILYEDAARVAEEITADKGTALPVACDVSDRESVRAARQATLEALGPALLLVANAGVTSWQRLTDMSESDVDWMFGVNLMGVVNCLHAFLPDMLSAGDGHVCATSSVAGLAPGWLPYHTAYAATKLGVIGLMLNLRHELAECGVGASVLVPGPVATGIGENTARARPRRFGGPSRTRVEIPAIAKERVDTAMSFRTPEEVATMLLDAVRDNAPIVLTDSDCAPFQNTYVDLITTAARNVPPQQATAS